MHTLPEPDLHWSEHYPKYGFAVAKKLLDDAFIADALREVRKIAGNDLPFDQWTTENTKHRYGDSSNNAVLAAVYDQPGIRAMIDTMFGSADAWDGARHFQLFISPYDTQRPADAPRKPFGGHIDFADNKPFPVLGNGFVFQASLIDAEPGSGNIHIWPGTHKQVQAHAMADADWRYPKDIGDIDQPEPYEFVAEAGDVLIFSHLVLHSASPSCAAKRTPRIGLHCQANQHDWLSEVDPDAPQGLSPWAQSLAQNGRYVTRCDEKAMMHAVYSDARFERLRKERAATIDRPRR